MHMHIGGTLNAYIYVLPGGREIKFRTILCMYQTDNPQKLAKLIIFST